MSEKFFTNSSLQRTSQNRLIEACVPKEIIQKKPRRISEVADAAFIDSSKYEGTISRALHGKGLRRQILQFKKSLMTL